MQINTRKLRAMITRRYNTRFSIMVAGQKGAGKSTFFNSLVNKEIVKMAPSADIDLYLLNLDYDGSMQKITFIDTPGFGDSMNDEALQDSIVDYIKEQFDSYIEEETKIRRNARYEDTRMHCLIYMIPTTGMGLKQRDVVFLKKISGLVNVIPVINKCEWASPAELSEMKKLIRSQIAHHKIRVFDFENEDAKLPISKSINSMVPFACVLPEKIGDELRIRTCPAGIVEIDNPKHSDYAVLRDLLLNTHTEALIETTDTDLYERYRSDALENILHE